MSHEMNDLLEESFVTDPVAYRKKLLLLWIRIFAWIFLVMGILAVVSVVLSLFVNNLTLAIYHIETNNALSLAGVAIIAIYLLKGFTAYGLLWAKKWGIQLAIVDGVAGIIICLVALFLPATFTGESGISFPLELLLLIPYLIKMLKIKDQWAAV